MIIDRVEDIRSSRMDFWYSIINDDSITNTPHGFLVFSGVKRIFVRQQDDIYIMLEWDQINIHLKDLLSSGYLGDAIRT